MYGLWSSFRGSFRRARARPPADVNEFAQRYVPAPVQAPRIRDVSGAPSDFWYWPLTGSAHVARMTNYKPGQRDPMDNELVSAESVGIADDLPLPDIAAAAGSVALETPNDQKRQS